MSWLTTWWVWIAVALIFAILETVAPVFVFLGFTVGAAVVGFLVLIGVDFTGALAWMLVIFALTSLASTLVFRRVFAKDDQVKTFTDDINS